MATVPPRFTGRLAAMGSGANRPPAFNNARSFAASTRTTAASSKPAGGIHRPDGVFHCCPARYNSAGRAFRKTVRVA